MMDNINQYFSHTSTNYQVTLIQESLLLQLNLAACVPPKI